MLRKELDVIFNAIADGPYTGAQKATLFSQYYLFKRWIEQLIGFEEDSYPFIVCGIYVTTIKEHEIVEVNLPEEDKYCLYFNISTTYAGKNVGTTKVSIYELGELYEIATHYKSVHIRVSRVV